MPANGKAPAFLRQGYKRSVQTKFKMNERTGLMTPTTETVHWDGRQDAHVRPELVVVRFRSKE